MQAVVTAIRAYKGVPAFEYEIQSADGRVQAFDFVIVHPHEGETWDDLTALVTAFLRQRAAEWEGADTPAKRSATKELVTGGVRLARATDTGDAPDLSGERPAARHLITVTERGG